MSAEGLTFEEHAARWPWCPAHVHDESFGRLLGRLRTSYAGGPPLN